ncbi:MAG: polysaccharide deacetylase family protein [Puniceicoccales bacterium]|nr:polysaccharide deacetylase family protein [Puniceicoccales bacterium]
MRAVFYFTLLFTALGVPAAAKEIALTFDDLPCNEFALPAECVLRINKKILRCLGREHIRTVGFVNENAIHHRSETNGRKKILKSWIKSGHELGNHTASHSKLSQVGYENFCQDILRGEVTTNGILKKYHRRPMQFFRYPFLDIGPEPDRSAVKSFLRAHGYTIARITIDSLDWSYNAKYQRALKVGDKKLANSIRSAFLVHLRTQFHTMANRPQNEILLLHVCTLTSLCVDDIVGLLRKEKYSFCSLGRALESWK